MVCFFLETRITQKFSVVTAIIDHKTSPSEDVLYTWRFLHLWNMIMTRTSVSSLCSMTFHTYKHGQDHQPLCSYAAKCKIPWLCLDWCH